MVAEYKSSKGPDAYHLVVFDSVSGNITASGFDRNTEMVESYRLHSTANDGAAVMMAMMPALLIDKEFEEYFQTYMDARTAGYPDMTKATESMAILCDNAYNALINSAASKIVTDEYGMKKVVVDKQAKEDIQQNLMLQIF